VLKWKFFFYLVVLPFNSIGVCIRCIVDVKPCKRKEKCKSQKPVFIIFPLLIHKMNFHSALPTPTIYHFPLFKSLTHTLNTHINCGLLLSFIFSFAFDFHFISLLFLRHRVKKWKLKENLLIYLHFFTFKLKHLYSCNIFISHNVCFFHLKSILSRIFSWHQVLWEERKMWCLFKFFFSIEINFQFFLSCTYLLFYFSTNRYVDVLIKKKVLRNCDFMIMFSSGTQRWKTICEFDDEKICNIQKNVIISIFLHFQFWPLCLLHLLGATYAFLCESVYVYSELIKESYMKRVCC
jgi:hypothetical protein